MMVSSSSSSSIMEVSIVHHVGIVLFLLWLLDFNNLCHPLAYVASLIYLYLVNGRLLLRMRKKIQFEEKRQANQRKVLSDSETVRWLNYAMEKIWPVCLEQIVSQKFLLPVVPWFLDKYKPWPAKKAVMQNLYMGRSPPIFTGIRVLSQPSEDDHLVLELGVNFLAADDMSARLDVKLRKTLGFGMWTKLHVAGMHLEGKVMVGVKFLQNWPYIGRLRVYFVEPPYFQMTVKPLQTHVLDVTELPGIAGWLDKLLSVAFEQTLVEPNMLVVDVDKFASPQAENWFSVDEKEPVAYVKVEVIEAANMKPSALNGLADPYVRGKLGRYSFTTKVLKKTLSPNWHEEFKVPICTWDALNPLEIEVCDKDHFVDDSLGACTVNIFDFKDGQRHAMWLPLQNIKMGRLHLGITVLECATKDEESDEGGEKEICTLETENSVSSSSVDKDCSKNVQRQKSSKVGDSFEPINIIGQQQTGIWVMNPGSEAPRKWEPRKGKSRRFGDEFLKQINGSSNNSDSTTCGPSNSQCTGTADKRQRSKPKSKFWKRLRKIGLFCGGNPKRKDGSRRLVERMSSENYHVYLDGKEGTSVEHIKIPDNVLSKEPEAVSSTGRSG